MSMWKMMALCLVSISPAHIVSASEARSAVEERMSAVRSVDFGGGYLTTLAYHPEAEIAGNWKPHPLAGLVEVGYVLKPSADSFIRCVLLLPAKARWDGRLRAFGSGGPGGFIRMEELAKPAQAGSAVAYTDLGTSDRKMSLPGRICDFGHRATHLMTCFSKRIIETFYGRPPCYSYFEGESTGGNQAFQELLRYPDDYDGIVAGVPAFARMATHAYFQWNWRKLHDDAGQEIFTRPELVAITNAAERYFAAKGIVGVDRRYAPEKGKGIQEIAEALAPTLATVDKRSRMHDLWTGPLVNGKRVGKGVALGAWLPHAGGNDWLLRWEIGKDRGLEMVTDKELENWMTKWGKECDAVSTDMSAFAKRGGKLIVYAGEIDPCIPWEPLCDWHRVANSGDSRVMYLLPERAHGGPPEFKNAFALIRDWVENGRKPSTAEVVHVDGSVRLLDPIPVKEED